MIRNLLTTRTVALSLAATLAVVVGGLAQAKKLASDAAVVLQPEP